MKELRTEGKHDAETFRVVWDGDSETDCVEICRELQLAAIQYSVSQQPVSRSSKMGVIWRFEIAVRASQYGLGKGNSRFERRMTTGWKKEEQAFAIEESAASASEASADQNQPKASSFFRKRHPEDATVEVWS